LASGKGYANEVEDYSMTYRNNDVVFEGASGISITAGTFEMNSALLPVWTRMAEIMSDKSIPCPAENSHLRLGGAALQELHPGLMQGCPDTTMLSSMATGRHLTIRQGN